MAFLFDTLSLAVDLVFTIVLPRFALLCFVMFCFSFFLSFGDTLYAYTFFSFFFSSYNLYPFHLKTLDLESTISSSANHLLISPTC